MCILVCWKTFIKVHSKICFPSCSFSKIFELHCAKFDARSVFSLSAAEGLVPTENQIISGGPASMISDITNSLGANHGPILKLLMHEIEVDACSAQTLSITSEIVNTLCPEAKYLHIPKLWNFTVR